MADPNVELSYRNILETSQRRTDSMKGSHGSVTDVRSTHGLTPATAILRVSDVLRAAAALVSSRGAAEDHGEWRGRACDGRQQLLGSTLKAHEVGAAAAASTSSFAEPPALLRHCRRSRRLASWLWCHQTGRR